MVKKKKEKTYKKGKKTRTNSSKLFFFPFLVLISTVINLQKEKNCKQSSNLNEEKTE